MLKLKIEDNGSLSSVLTNVEESMDSTYLFNLFSFDELSVDQPAYYDFPNIEKGIAMPPTEKVYIFESHKSITHYEPWDAPEYQAGDFDSFTLTVKYNLSKNTIKLVKYEDDENWFDTFCNQNNFDKAYFIDNDIKKYLSSKDLDGGKLLAEQEIKPKLIVVNASTK